MEHAEAFEEEHRGFAEPDETIIEYAKAHNIQLDLRSKIVQRVLRLRMYAEGERERDDKTAAG